MESLSKQTFGLPKFTYRYLYFSLTYKYYRKDKSCSINNYCLDKTARMIQKEVLLQPYKYNINASDHFRKFP